MESCLAATGDSVNILYVLIATLLFCSALALVIKRRRFGLHASFFISVVLLTAALLPFTASVHAAGCTVSPQKSPSAVSTENTSTEPPLANDDEIILDQDLDLDGNMTGRVNLLTNDSAPAGVTLDAQSVDIDQATPGVQHTLVIDTFSFTYLPSSGELTFVATAFSSISPLEVDYTVKGSNGVVSNIATAVFNRPAPSDARLKRNIVFLRKLDNGINLYRFQYLTDDQVYVGVIAQEILLTHPSTVYLMPDGFYAVNYKALGLKMQTYEQWLNAQ